MAYISREEAIKAVLGLAIVSPEASAYADAVIYALQNLPEDSTTTRARWIFTGMSKVCSCCHSNIPTKAAHPH